MHNPTYSDKIALWTELCRPYVRAEDNMSLLEELAARSGCDYLSDLKSNENLKKIILATDIYKYDLNEWNDAVK